MLRTVTDYTGSAKTVTESRLIYLPPHAKFSAHVCLSTVMSGALNPGTKSEYPWFDAIAYIASYQCFKDATGSALLPPTMEGGDILNNVPNGNYVQFELFVEGAYIWGEANANGAVFIES